MNLLGGLGIIGLIFVLIFFSLIIIFAVVHRKRTDWHLRTITAYAKLERAIGLAVEAGTRIHISLGRGNISGMQGGSALVGLSVLERVARAASISDRPPVATSGDGTLGILSQDTLHSGLRAIGAESQYDSTYGQVSGLTPFSYAAGTLPVIYDEHVSACFLSGHFESEVALITDAAERSGSLTLAGSDSITAQAILYATAQEPLIGEELYAAGAFVRAGDTHLSSLRAQDVLRWTLVVIILAGAALKAVGVL